MTLLRFVRLLFLASGIYPFDPFQWTVSGVLLATTSSRIIAWRENKLVNLLGLAWDVLSPHRDSIDHGSDSFSSTNPASVSLHY
jgi:hypothetical protein